MGSVPNSPSCPAPTIAQRAPRSSALPAVKSIAAASLSLPASASRFSAASSSRIQGMFSWYVAVTSIPYAVLSGCQR